MDNENKEIRRLKCSAFDMLEEIVKLREENANLKKHVIDIENKHKEAVVDAVGHVVVRYEKERKEMFQKIRFYRGEMVKASNSLERLRSFNTPVTNNTPVMDSENFARRVSCAARRLKRQIQEHTDKET